VQEHEEEYLEKKAFVFETSKWEEEDSMWVKNKFGEPYKIVRLIFKKDKEEKKRNPRRLISIVKKTKSIGIDVESVFGLTAAMRILASDYVPENLK